MAIGSENKLILASASPRRRELLASMGWTFSVIIPEIDETPMPDETPHVFVERMAQEKADNIDAKGTIIAADTVVALEGAILGKPVNTGHACKMLKALSDHSHEVITGVCVKGSKGRKVFSVTTQVTFRKLDDEEIKAYVESGEPMDKAGAYAIQGGAAHMVRAINGSYTNVVGLPLCELFEALI